MKVGLHVVTKMRTGALSLSARSVDEMVEDSIDLKKVEPDPSPLDSFLEGYFDIPEGETHRAFERRNFRRLQEADPIFADLIKILLAREKEPGISDEKIWNRLKHHKDWSFGQTAKGHPKPSTSCLLYTSPSPRDKRQSRMPSSA